jgi:serine/threonine-protein kinase
VKPSDVIEGRYRLERLLGTGGMSEVWLAEDERLGREVAVKILRDSFGDDLGGTLEREARLVARLQHPNIVAVFDAGLYEGHYYLVAEYVEGASLRDTLTQRGRLTEAEAVRYGVQVASALQYAHAQGVIHCDVKPENILLGPQGIAKVADFGVADTVTRTVTPGEARDILGTIAYLAPEVIQGAPADARSDVYSLGLTVYELVAGRLPFTGTSAPALAGQRLGTPAPPLRTFAADASVGLQSVLARALALSPADRYQSAAEFGAALRATPPPAVIPPVAARPPVRAPQRRDTARLRTPPPASASSPGGGLILAIVVIALIAILAGVVGAIALNRGGGDSNVLPTPTPALTIPTRAATPTATPTPTVTASPSASPSASASATPATRTPSPSPSPATQTPVPTASPSPATSPTASPTR